MTDIEKIRAEIERLKETSLKCGAIGKNSRIVVLNEILSFIDSLSEEPVSELWHDSNKEQPKAGSNVAIWDGESGEILTRCVKVNPNRKWAYMEDMLNKKEEPVSEDYRERYKNITRSDAFKSAYENKSLGEVMSVEGEEPVSDELEEAAWFYADMKACLDKSVFTQKEVNEKRSKLEYNWEDIRIAFKAGAKWHKEHLWNPADGDDLPEIDREVIALEGIVDPTATDCLCGYKVVFAYRPTQEGYDGKSIATGIVEHYTPKTYGEGGWNIPNIVYWLDVELPKEIEL